MLRFAYPGVAAASAFSPLTLASSIVSRSASVVSTRLRRRYMCNKYRYDVSAPLLVAAQPSDYFEKAQTIRLEQHDVTKLHCGPPFCRQAQFCTGEGAFAGSRSSAATVGQRVSVRAA